MRQSSVAVKMRPATLEDTNAICALAEHLGSGMTNLPSEPARMEPLIADSLALMGGDTTKTRAILALDAGGKLAGTASVWTRIGVKRPFYSFHITPHFRSMEGGPAVTTRTLELVEEFTGCSEVGGLVVDPKVRGLGVGRLAARTRYLFIAQHRDMFAARTVSELRGWQDENGKSPVWRALGKKFFRMPFDVADRMTAGDDDIIRPLAPQHPIYVDLLPRAAQEALGKPHDSGRRALELLFEEGFRDSGHVDIFDGGPTVWSPTDEIHTIQDSRVSPVGRIADEVTDGVDSLVCTGRGMDFRSGRGPVMRGAEGVTLPKDLARRLNVEPGMEVRHVRY